MPTHLESYSNKDISERERECGAESEPVIFVFLVSFFLFSLSCQPLVSRSGKSHRCMKPLIRSACWVKRFVQADVQLLLTASAKRFLFKNLRRLE